MNTDKKKESKKETEKQRRQQAAIKGQSLRKLFEAESAFRLDAVDIFLETCIEEYGKSKAIEKAFKAWGRGEVAGYSHDNPFRLACQAAYYGIDAGSDFRAETVQNWKKSGYEVNADARPLFVFQPLFDAERDAKKRAEAEASGELVVKKRKFYRVAMLFALEDCQKVREVKRRVQKVKTETAAALDEAFTPAAPAAPVESWKNEQMELAL